MSDDFLKELYLKAYNFPPEGVAKHLAGLRAVRDHYCDAAVRDFARPEAGPIQRYDLYAYEAWGEAELEVSASADGKWVKWDDVKRLLPQRDES